MRHIGLEQGAVDVGCVVGDEHSVAVRDVFQALDLRLYTAEAEYGPGHCGCQPCPPVLARDHEYANESDERTEAEDNPAVEPVYAPRDYRAKTDSTIRHVTQITLC